LGGEGAAYSAKVMNNERECGHSSIVIG